MAKYSMISAPDFMPEHMLRDVQNKKFLDVFHRVYTSVSWYRNLLEENNVNPDSIKSLADLSKLPFIKKTDLRDTYPTGMFAVPMSKILRFHASSGTTGKPIVMGYTQHDLDAWSEATSRALAMFGLDENDVLQVGYGYGLFTGGLGLHDGGQRRGCTVLPISGGNTERQLMLMRDLGTTAVACTPSYFLHIIDHARKVGFDWKTTKLRVGIFGAEPWSDEMRKFIEDETGIETFDIYGLTEVSGPGVGGDCPCHNGIHIFEDHFYPEIVDPETLQPLPDGEEGELVFTTLDKEGIPLIRYRTRDMTRLISERCACGRTLRRIGRITHRSDDMMIIRGVNVFPGQVESALLAIDPNLVNYQIYLSKGPDGLDVIEVKVEPTPEKFSVLWNDDAAKEKFRRLIAEKLQRVVGINFKTTLVAPDSIPRSEGKSKRVFDNRHKKD